MFHQLRHSWRSLCKRTRIIIKLPSGTENRVPAVKPLSFVLRTFFTRHPVHANGAVYLRDSRRVGDIHIWSIRGRHFASVLFSRVLGGTAAHECNSSSRLLQLGPHPIPRRGMRALLRDIRFVYFAIRFYEKFPGCKPFEQTTIEQLKISSKQKSASSRQTWLTKAGLLFIYLMLRHTAAHKNTNINMHTQSY